MTDFAFPFGNHDSQQPDPGMTLRAYFAAAALQGLLTNPGRVGGFKDTAGAAVLFADALLSELEK